MRYFNNDTYKRLQMRRLLLMGLMCLTFGVAMGEVGTKSGGVSSSIKKNWYLQMGLDMTLQNPYGYDFSEVFPNGKTFGVNGAMGHWFTPEIGLRAKVNWENGIGLFRNNHATWLAPVDRPGVNMEKGGYMSVVGDVQLDIHNLLCGYRSDRRWNLQLFPRAGIVYNFGVAKGSPLVGIGIGNTYRISDKWLLYADMAYNGVSSGFSGVGTDVGSGSNGYMDFNIGVQYNIGESGFGGKGSDGYSFWNGWFLQAGLDMTLLNPYGKDFSESFTKGRSFGLNGAIGKWFSPEIAVRGRLNWENGFPLFENKKLEWMGHAKESASNMEDGGCLMMYMDVLLSVKHIFFGYEKGERWDMYLFPRAGLGRNISLKSLSPLVGAGIGTSYRINNRWSIYADTAYQGITSEFMGGLSTTGMSVSTGFNGIWDFNVGVQYEL